MRTYEKPRLMALSLNGNDQLCGSCAAGTTLYDDAYLAKWLMDTYKFGDSSDGVQRKDFAGVFGNEAQCADVQIESYCKFSAMDEGTPVVAWS